MYSRPAQEAKIESEDPRGFTMGALMHLVQLVYDERAHPNDRIFEGLKLEAPGRYSINTGS